MTREGSIDEREDRRGVGGQSKEGGSVGWKVG